MLDQKTRELVAIGASVVANCQSCLDYHVKEARKAGAGGREMKDAVAVGRMVRKGAGDKMDKFADEMLRTQAAEGEAAGACCGGAHDE